MRVNVVWFWVLGLTLAFALGWWSRGVQTGALPAIDEKIVVQHVPLPEPAADPLTLLLETQDWQGLLTYLEARYVDDDDLVPAIDRSAGEVERILTAAEAAAGAEPTK